VKKIGELPNPPNRPTYLFGVVDLRLLIAMDPGVDPRRRLDTYAVECPNCSSVGVSDRVMSDCPACSQEFDIEHARSLLEVVAK
jgi:hypothetical protein